VATSSTVDLALGRLEFCEVTEATWADFVRLFERRGSPKSCWCMVWRATAEEARRTDGKHRRAALERRVALGVPIGLLAYLEGEPVGWCSIAPRSTYRPLGGSEYPGVEPDQIWSVTCFFLTRELRGQGIMPHLLDAAVEHAQQRGAVVIEGYPVDEDSPSYRFMGFVPTFEDAGFIEVARAGTRRHVMRRDMPTS